MSLRLHHLWLFLPIALTLSLCVPGRAADVTDIIVGSRSRDLRRIAPLARIPWPVQITNTSSQPLEIRNVRTSCSCLVTPWRTQTLPPKSGLTMDLELIASGVTGPFAEHLDFESSHPSEPHVRLEIRGEVYRSVEAVPEFVLLPVTPDSWADETARTRILNHEDHPIRVIEVKHRHPSFAARLLPVREGFEYLLEMRATGPLPNGNHYGRFDLITTSTQIPTIEVTAFVPGLPAVALGPRTLRLPDNSTPNTTSSPVFIRSTTSHVLEIRPGAPLPASTRILLESIEAGRLHRLRLVTTEGFKVPASGRIEVPLESNHPAHPSLRVAVTFVGSGDGKRSVSGGP